MEDGLIIKQNKTNKQIRIGEGYTESIQEKDLHRRMYNDPIQR